MRCKECKSYYKPKWDTKRPHQGRCNNEKMLVIGDYYSIGVDELKDGQVETNYAINIHEDFGCVHFQNKDNA